MFFVYILYSASGKKTYVGFTTDIQRRLLEHNFTEVKGFTLRYRPWNLIRTEAYQKKSDATTREKFLKTGRGREEIKTHIAVFLSNGAVSAVAEKD